MVLKDIFELAGLIISLLPENYIQHCWATLLLHTTKTGNDSYFRIRKSAFFHSIWQISL